jgi:dolichol kinase
MSFLLSVPLGGLAGPLGEVVRVAAVGTVFLAIFATAELWRRRLHPPTEVTRKFIHFAGGLVVLSFPWVFTTHWSVLALGVSSLTLMTLGRRFGFLPSLHDVTRRSKGEIHYAIAVYLLFVIARHQPIYYAISLFTLIVSDALAALLGQAYGRWTYTVESGRKSWEGSAVFFLVTFLGVHLTLLLGTPLDRGHSVILALQVALLVTSFEAISLYGNDNLIVPLATYYLLQKMTHSTAAGLGLQLGAQLAFLLIAGIVAWRSRVLSASSAIAVHLVLYAAFSLGGVWWPIAPGIALFACLWLDPNTLRPAPSERRYQVLAVFYLSIAAVTMIFADNTFATLVRGAPSLQHGHPFFELFVGVLAAQVAILAFAYARSHRSTRRWSRLATAPLAIAIGWLAVAPVSLWAVRREVGLESLLVTIAVCAIAVVLYAGARRLPGWPKGSLWDLRLQSLCAAVAVLFLVPAHLYWIGAIG